MFDRAWDCKHTGTSFSVTAHAFATQNMFCHWLTLTPDFVWNGPMNMHLEDRLSNVYATTRIQLLLLSIPTHKKHHIHPNKHSLGYVLVISIMTKVAVRCSKSPRSKCHRVCLLPEATNGLKDDGHPDYFVVLTTWYEWCGICESRLEFNLDPCAQRHHRLTGGWTGRWMDRHMEGQTNRWMDRADVNTHTAINGQKLV